MESAAMMSLTGYELRGLVSALEELVLFASLLSIEVSFPVCAISNVLEIQHLAR